MKAKLKATTSAAAQADAALHMVANAEKPSTPRRRRGGEIPYPERVYATTQHTAEALGICMEMVYRLMRAGKIRSIKIGARRLVEVASVIELTAGGDIQGLPRYAGKAPAKDAPPSTPAGQASVELTL
jgi:hypothetical protein